MKFLKSFFRRITDDLKVKKLIPLKILFFVHASTLFVLYPYLTIHMRELGINVEEAAIMSAVTPVVSIVMPPLAGMLADKIGNFRLLLALSSVLGGASALLLLVVPVGRLTVTFPQQLELLLSCSADQLQLLHLQEHPCTPPHPYTADVNLTVQACGFACQLPDASSPTQDSGYYAIGLRSAAGRETAAYRHSAAPLDSGAGGAKPSPSATRLLTNNDDYGFAVRRVAGRRLFFPAAEVCRVACASGGGGNASCSFAKEDGAAAAGPRPRQLASYRARVAQPDASGYAVRALRALAGPGESAELDSADGVQCRDGFAEESTEVSVWSDAAGLLQHCRPGCVATAPRSALCDNASQLIELDPAFTFWSYLAVRVFIGIISGTAFAMFEGAVIAILREQQADYGLQRIYGSVGGMISSPLSGLLIDYASRGKGYTDFRPAFYLYAVLKIMSGALMLSIDLQFKQPAQNLVKDVLTVFCNIEIVALFIACFIMGTAWGYIESFLFWLLQDLGASKSLMGITITVGGVAGLPLLVMSGPIIRRLGHANVLFIGFIFYAIRLMGYSVIYNPWLCLAFEALESVTSSLSFTAAVTYAARLSSATTDTSVQGLLGGIYYGVGKGSGSLIGGYLMKFLGTRPTYQIFSVFTLLTGCIYYLFNKFYIRKRPQRETNDIYKKKPKLDIESNENCKEKSLEIDAIDEKIASDLEANQLTVRCSSENTDGGSDSGVDNLAYNTDGETSTASPTTPEGNDKEDKHDKN